MPKKPATTRPLEPQFGPRFQGFHSLMRIRLREVLLVSSLYDLHVFEEDGRLYELIREEYKGLNLSHVPELTQVSSGQEALDMVMDEQQFDLIILTPHIQDMPAEKLSQGIRDLGLNIPIVLLAYDNREFSTIHSRHDASLFDRIFVWQGDFRILIGIIKHLEDYLNVEHDTQTVGVQVIILVEDSVRYYSSFLPLIYTELFNQSRRLILEGVSLSDRYLRLRARPKILLATNYEDAWYYYEKYRKYILGVISDINFSKDGEQNPDAGLLLVQQIKELDPDTPVLLQSQLPENEPLAHASRASFLLKGSPTLLNDLRHFMIEHFSFGDFVFRNEAGEELGRAQDLLMLEKQLQIIPDECIKYHAERHHFSNWLKARTEFWIANRFRPRQLEDYDSINALRQDLSSMLREYRKVKQRAIITDFNRDTFDVQNSFARIGDGSLGGKARGLSFVNMLLNNYYLYNHFPDTEIRVPPAVVLGTDVFDQFLDDNGLRHFALSECADKEILNRFVTAPHFPEHARTQLAQFLGLIRQPLAVRSSSLLEDSQYHPFAGVYETLMLPNNEAGPGERLDALLHAIKRVYASTFYKRAREYIRITNYRLEEEKMAVVVQRMVGTAHRERFYPDFAGVARSHNFYPVAPQQAAEGLVSVALGLGQQVVEGGDSVKFCPRYPRHLPQFSDIQMALNSSQKHFYALNLNWKYTPGQDATQPVEVFPLDVAEADGVLASMGSAYSAENQAIYSGLSRPGMRLVTFAPILEHKLFPLPQIMELLLDIGRRAMGTPIEIEFAVNLSSATGEPREFGLLQMRPMVLERESVRLKMDHHRPEEQICSSSSVLGNGVINTIFDIVMVDRENFERARSREVAEEVAQYDARLRRENRPYLLVGMGRWGSMDPWLGIPVRWEQIAGAAAIIEAGFPDLDVQPSQGSHFFQNLTAFSVAYFTISANNRQHFLDWGWLEHQPPHSAGQYVRHLQFTNALEVKLDGHEQKGIVLKPLAQ